jgi:hypothetical protein
MEVKQHSGLKNREKETGLDSGFRRYKGKKKKLSSRLAFFAFILSIWLIHLLPIITYVCHLPYPLLPS